MTIRRVPGVALGFLLLAAALFFPVTGARAVLVQRGDLFVSFDGRLTPDALPRHALAPITVGVEGRVRVLSGGAPPALRRITIALNRGGRPAILAHIYGTTPTAIARVIAFHIRHASGAFGTILTGYLPPSLNHYGYVRLIALELHREFTYHGARRSYISAACAAPPGFPGATFPFARATMGFADGRVLSSTITRSCRVRGR